MSITKIMPVNNEEEEEELLAMAAYILQTMKAIDFALEQEQRARAQHYHGDEWFVVYKSGAC